jgi:hypothetical protein
MKFLVVSLLVGISPSLMAFDFKAFLLGKSDKAYSCKSGSGSNHTNPDNSLGGFVAKTAKVEAGAIVAPNAQVCDQALVKAGAKILDKAVIGGRAQINNSVEVSGTAQVMGEARVSGNVKINGNAVIVGSPQISGTTQISGLAKIEGGSKVHNAIICQASQITNFDVIDSDYYCQTEDPEPPHPGEMGMKTLLGVDTDLDGVRDDVEIWINQRFSNTPDKDFYNERQAFKQLVRAYQKKFKYKNFPDKYREAVSESFDSDTCLNKVPDFSKMTNSEKRHFAKISSDRNLEIRAIEKELDVEFYNTPERIKVELDSRSMSHGTTLSPANKTKDGCYFQKRAK